jgi:hypothetical protein
VALRRVDVADEAADIHPDDSADAVAAAEPDTGDTDALAGPDHPGSDADSHADADTDTDSHAGADRPAVAGAHGSAVAGADRASAGGAHGGADRRTVAGALRGALSGPVDRAFVRADRIVRSVERHSRIDEHNEARPFPGPRFSARPAGRLEKDISPIKALSGPVHRLIR